MSATIRGTTTETVTASQITTLDYNLGLFVYCDIHFRNRILFIIFVYYLASIDASPIPPINRSLGNSCTDLARCRTIWNIALSPSSRVLGLPSIPASHVQGSERRKIVYRGRYRTHFCRLSSIAFRCLVCARVCSGLGNQTIPEISDQSISHEKGLPLHPLDGNDLVYSNFDSLTIPTEV